MDNDRPLSDILRNPAPRVFWRTDGTYRTRTAAERRARAVRWAPTVIERGLVVRIVARPDGYAVELGANNTRLLRTRED